MYCKQVNIISFKSYFDQKSFKFFRNLNCNRNFLIYLMECSWCKKKIHRKRQNIIWYSPKISWARHLTQMHSHHAAFLPNMDITSEFMQTHINRDYNQQKKTSRKKQGCLRNVSINIYTYIHTYTHTYILHTYIHTYIPKHIHTY